MVSFFLTSLVYSTKKVRYVGGAVRLVLRLIPIKWEVRPDYVEPVQPDVSPMASPAGPAQRIE